jgi:small-conductance mechanosensitive channel
VSRTLRVRVRAIVASAVLLLAGAAYAQEVGPPAPTTPITPTTTPTPVPPTPPTPGATPAAIPLPEIALRAEATVEWLRGVATEIAPDAEIGAIVEAFETRKQELAAVAESLEESIGARAGLDKLQDLERQLSAQREEILAWQTKAQTRAEALEARVTTLAAVKDTWDLTLEAAKAEGAPDAVLTRVRDLRKDIKATRDAVQKERATVLTLQGEIAQLVTSSRLHLDDVHRARFEIRGRFFEADRKPLWSAFTATRSVETVVSRVGDSLKRDWTTLRTFAELERTRIFRHALIFLALLAVAFWIRSRARKRRAAGKQIGATPRVYERPLAVALIGTLLVTPWLYPHAPLVVMGLIGLLFAMPTLAIVLDVLMPELRGLWLAIVGFYVLDRIRYTVQAVELIERSLFVLEMLAAMTLVLWLRRSAHAERLARLVGSERTLDRILRVMAVAFGVAALCEVLGLSTLAKVVGDGLLTTVYAGVVIYSAVAIIVPVIPVVLSSKPLGLLNAVKENHAAIERALIRVVTWAGVFAWIRTALDRTTLLDPLWAATLTLLRAPIGPGGAAISLAAILGFGIVLTGWLLFARIVGALLEEDVLPRTRLGRGIPHAISRTTIYAISVLGVVMAFGAAGIDLSKVTVLAGALGVGIGFGLQNVVNNFISGLILLYERPIQIGDTVEVGPLTGEVKRIGIRSSTLRTFQGAEVIVPNANLIQEQVVNWTLSDRQRRIELPIGVAYGTDPQRVIDILLGAANSVPEVNEDPAPLALFRGFGDNSLDFELRCWTGFENYLPIQSKIAIAVNAALGEAGISIPFPQRDVRVTLAREARDADATKLG